MFSEKCDQQGGRRCGRQCHQQMEADDRPASSRRTSSWTRSLALAGALSLCSVTTGALAQQAPNSIVMGSPGSTVMGSSGTIGVPVQEPLCASSSDDERVHAIYFDLDMQLPAGQGSLIERSATRVRKQQWFDVSFNQSDVACPLDPAESTLILESLPGVGCEIVLPPVDPRLDAAASPSADTGFSLELISLDPSALALILEFASGESWEIGLATLDGGPFERTAVPTRANHPTRAIPWLVSWALFWPKHPS